MNITAVVVIYNKEVSQSVTCKRIQEQRAITLLVVDNSTDGNTNQSYCESEGIAYISMNGNKGLSKAYNAAVESLVNSVDVIVWLDDDTEVPSAYFETLEASLNSFPEVDIFAPIIRGQNGVIYSPNNYNFLKNRLVKVPTEEVKQETFNAISSCLAVRMRVYNGYRYNEELFVDEIDHCFFRDQREFGKRFRVLEIEINQRFHQRERNINANAVWGRVQIRITDIFRHARLMGGGKYTFLAFIKCCGLGIQIGEKSKSLCIIAKASLLSCKLLVQRG